MARSKIGGARIAPGSGNLQDSSAVIPSGAKQSIAQRFQSYPARNASKVGLLRRFAPRNDVEEKSAVIMRMNDAPVCGASACAIRPTN
jgi:hypothetical protein